MRMRAVSSLISLLIVARQLLKRRRHDQTRTSPAGARRTRRMGRRGGALRRSTGKRRHAPCAQSRTIVDANVHALHSVALLGVARYMLEGAADHDTNT